MSTSCLFFVTSWCSTDAGADASERALQNHASCLNADAYLFHELKPFTGAFAFLCLYYIVIFPMSKWCVSRKESEEETGADDRLYKEVCDAESETLGAQGKWNYRLPAPLADETRRPGRVRNTARAPSSPARR